MISERGRSISYFVQIMSKLDSSGKFSAVKGALSMRLRKEVEQRQLPRKAGGKYDSQAVIHHIEQCFHLLPAIVHGEKFASSDHV